MLDCILWPLKMFLQDQKNMFWNLKFCLEKFQKKHFMIMKLNISFWTMLIWNGLNIFRNPSNSYFLCLTILLLLLWISARNVLNHPALDNFYSNCRACTEDTSFVVLNFTYLKVSLPVQLLKAREALLCPGHSSCFWCTTNILFSLTCFSKILEKMLYRQESYLGSVLLLDEPLQRYFLYQKIRFNMTFSSAIYFL